jgi:hypothetical protein
MSAVIFFGLFLAQYVVSYLERFSFMAATAALFRGILMYPVPISLCMSALFSYHQLSFLLLGSNLRTARMLASIWGVVCVVATICGASAFSPESGLAIYLWALAISLITGSVLLCMMLVLSHRRLPQKV